MITFKKMYSFITLLSILSTVFIYIVKFAFNWDIPIESIKILTYIMIVVILIKINIK